MYEQKHVHSEAHINLRTPFSDFSFLSFSFFRLGYISPSGEWVLMHHGPGPGLGGMGMGMHGHPARNSAGLVVDFPEPGKST